MTQKVLKRWLEQDWTHLSWSKEQRPWYDAFIDGGVASTGHRCEERGHHDVGGTGGKESGIFTEN